MMPFASLQSSACLEKAIEAITECTYRSGASLSDTKELSSAKCRLMYVDRLYRCSSRSSATIGDLVHNAIIHIFKYSHYARLSLSFSRTSAKTDNVKSLKNSPKPAPPLLR